MRRDPALIPLSRQHHHGLALDVMVRRALEVDSSPSSVAAECARCVRHYEAALIPHFRAEEQILFPAIEAELGPQALVAELVAEHRRLSALADSLRTSPALAVLTEFCDTLRRHIRTEENRLFEDVQARLTPETLARLGGLLAAGAPEVCII